MFVLELTSFQRINILTTFSLVDKVCVQVEKGWDQGEVNGTLALTAKCKEHQKPSYSRYFNALF